ncbi:MAG: hypothetical protein R3C02_04760 [Planctomycetaceae bacterium]
MAAKARSQPTKQPREIEGGNASKPQLIDCHLHQPLRSVDLRIRFGTWMRPARRRRSSCRWKPVKGVTLHSETVLHAYFSYPDSDHSHSVRPTSGSPTCWNTHSTLTICLAAVGSASPERHVPLKNKRVEAVIALCDELSWPITIHFQDGKGGYEPKFRRTGLPQMQTSADHRAYPIPWWANISADIPTEEISTPPVPSSQEDFLLDRLSATTQPVSPDLSAGSASTLSRETKTSRIPRTPQAILFGSDCPATTVKSENFDGMTGIQTAAILRRMISMRTARGRLYI